MTRRAVLSAAAGSAAIAGLPPTAQAGPPATTTAATAAGLDPSALELRALQLEPPVFLFETHMPEQVRARHGSQLRISAEAARSGSDQQVTGWPSRRGSHPRNQSQAVRFAWYGPSAASRSGGPPTMERTVCGVLPHVLSRLASACSALIRRASITRLP
ncbi:hypothetical protein [Catellatospora sp. NPDC049609]|uniref:hypothetical protein n=1 Tax=Catellatospora sp. NPDC049609 TaxID=3155505 RepID=UPI003422D4CB